MLPNLQDGDMGELDEEVAERARGTADISAFGNVLQEFLDEQVRTAVQKWVHAGVDASSRHCAYQVLWVWSARRPCCKAPVQPVPWMSRCTRLCT
eukprot:885317-Pelagomonas_calceolata.AAC.4